MARRSLPSLDSLVFFEAVAINKNFSKAALELNVTQAAVSKRIATLESQLGYRLFDRATRRPALTSEAVTLFERTKRALNYLDETFSDAEDEIEAPVRIGTNSTALSVFWVQDLLHTFTLSENACDISFVASNDLDEVLNSDLDIGIVYGTGKLNNWQTYLMLDEVLTPVASPAVADLYRRLTKYGIDDPKLAPVLLEYPRFAPDWVTWNMWFSHVGHDGLAALGRKGYRSYANSIGAAIAGKGIALGSLPMIGSELKSGKLELIDDSSYSTGRGYYLVHPADRPMNDNVKCLCDFIRQHARSSDCYLPGKSSKD